MCTFAKCHRKIPRIDKSGFDKQTKQKTHFLIRFLLKNAFLTTRMKFIENIIWHNFKSNISTLCVLHLLDIVNITAINTVSNVAFFWKNSAFNRLFTVVLYKLSKLVA